MTGKTCAYARVSSKDQKLNRQYDALEKFGSDHEMVFADRASGKESHNRDADRRGEGGNGALERRGRGSRLFAAKSIHNYMAS